jgi:hypothetical protein
MQYLCYIEKKTPEVLVKVEYEWPLDIKLVWALTFLIWKWWMDTSLSLVIDAIQWELEHEKIFKIFDKHCLIVDDIHNSLNKKIVTAADLFS